ncbi:ferredoxin (3Fe-4S) [Mycolicibacterium rhodesiae JS60]|nr:ferredoxin (3Fe-4S) [Mycolicibacterium rhodesiae JS60]
MKRINIDGDLCQGTRLCESVLSGVEFDDDGIAIATDTPVPDAIAARAESVCPSMAITVADA